MNTEFLQKYAQLIVEVGSNFQKGETMLIRAPIIAADLAREVARAAYKMGARKTIIDYQDEEFSKIRYQNESLESLTKIPQYHIDKNEEMVNEKVVLVAIVANNPDMFADVDAKILAESSKALRLANKKFSDATMSNKLRWTLVAYPNPAWAQKVFPKLAQQDAVQKLWEYIIKAIRLDVSDPVAAWQEHSKTVKRRAEYLNNANIKTLVYKNSLGTDFRIDMPKCYKFCGCSEYSQDGVLFAPNMPTEEIFAAPHKDTAEGKLVASMPLVVNGNVVEDFWFSFEKGKIVDFGAKQGKDVLQGLLDTDDAARYLGEIALVPYDSPIQNLKTLFYNTLFDENASCHFAVGKAYPTCLQNSKGMTEQQLSQAGLNVSLVHADFMIGTHDLQIDAITHDGKKIAVFANGNFAF